MTQGRLAKLIRRKVGASEFGSILRGLSKQSFFLWVIAPQFSQAPFLYLVATLVLSTPLLYHSVIAENFRIFSSCCRWCFNVGPLGSRYQGASLMYCGM